MKNTSAFFHLSTLRNSIHSCLDHDKINATELVDTIIAELESYKLHHRELADQAEYISDTIELGNLGNMAAQPVSYGGGEDIITFDVDSPYSSYSSYFNYEFPQID